MSRVEKICPICKTVHDDNLNVAVPGIYRGRYYDKADFLIQPELKKTLFHYTSLDCFKAIIASSKPVLRLTHYSQLNDWKELLLGIELLEKRIQLCVKTDERQKLLDELQQIKAKKHNCYLFSLSENEDCLSQWRAYAPSGGVSIGFSCNFLNNLSSKNIALAPCSYTNKDNKIDLNSIYKIAKYRVSKKGQNAIAEQQKADDKMTKYLLRFRGQEEEVQYSLSDFVEAVTTIKHYGFYEEQEWRLIAWNLEQSYTEQLSENNRRYIEIGFSTQRDIVSLIISPHGDKNMIRNVIEFYKNNGILSKDCEIIDSKIPYRG